MKKKHPAPEQLIRQLAEGDKPLTPCPARKGLFLKMKIKVTHPINRPPSLEVMVSFTADNYQLNHRAS